MARSPDHPRRPMGTFEKAEAAFKAVTAKPVESSPKTPNTHSVPGGREQVSLRLDREVLDYFQEDGPGWQDRINAALRDIIQK